MEIKNAVLALSALAQDTRLAVYRALVQAGPGGLAAGVIAEALALSPATLSFHLKALNHAGLVRVQSRGRFKIYTADYAQMNALLGYLTENCCAGARCDTVSACTPRPARTRRLRA